MTCCTQRWSCCLSINWGDGDATPTGSGTVEVQLFCHHQRARRCQFTTTVVWSHNNVTPTSCWFGWVVTVLSPSDLSRDNCFVMIISHVQMVVLSPLLTEVTVVSPQPVTDSVDQEPFVTTFRGVTVSSPLRSHLEVTVLPPLSVEVTAMSTWPTSDSVKQWLLCPDLIHRGGRVTDSIVWVTVMLPLPSVRRWSRGGWGQKGLSMSRWDVLERWSTHVSYDVWHTHISCTCVTLMSRILCHTHTSCLHVWHTHDSTPTNCEWSQGVTGLFHTTCCTQRWLCFVSINWRDGGATLTGCGTVEVQLFCHHQRARRCQFGL